MLARCTPQATGPLVSALKIMTMVNHIPGLSLRPNSCFQHHIGIVTRHPLSHISPETDDTAHTQWKGDGSRHPSQRICTDVHLCPVMQGVYHSTAVQGVHPSSGQMPTSDSSKLMETLKLSRLAYRSAIPSYPWPSNISQPL